MCGIIHTGPCKHKGTVDKFMSIITQGRQDPSEEQVRDFVDTIKLEAGTKVEQALLIATSTARATAREFQKALASSSAYNVNNQRFENSTNEVQDLRRQLDDHARNAHQLSAYYGSMEQHPTPSQNYDPQNLHDGQRTSTLYNGK